MGTSWQVGHWLVVGWRSSLVDCVCFFVRMAGIEDFCADPNEVYLDQCTKAQLMDIAETYSIDLAGLCDKRKENIKAVIKLQLVQKGILKKKLEQVEIQEDHLTFEQQKELLLLQLSHEKEKQKLAEVQMHIERMRFETEQAKVELESKRLGLIQEGKIFCLLFNKFSTICREMFLP